MSIPRPKLQWFPGPRPLPVFRSAICDCLSINVFGLSQARRGFCAVWVVVFPRFGVSIEARYSEKPPVIRALRAAGALANANSHGVAPPPAFLLASGVRIDAADSINCLVPAQVRARTYSGDTPLRIAVRKGGAGV
jgi:hypothetical protein